MSVKNKKQFGVWMDTHHATIVGHKDANSADFTVLGHAKNAESRSNSNENSANNLDKALLNQYFKEITSFMQNAEEVHVTGTGTAQEQFIHYLGQIPQFKNTVAKDSTTNKMSDELLIVFVVDKFN